VSSTDEERWLEAEQRIAPQPSPERRRAGRRAWLLTICAAVGYGVLAALIRALLPHSSTAASSDDSALPSTSWIGLATAGAGLIVVLAGLVVGLVTKRLRPTWERVDGALNRSQNRTVRLQIRGKEPVDPQHQAVVRAVAEQDVRTAAALIPCYIGTALMAVGLMLVLDLPELTAVLAGLLVLLAATAAWHYGSTFRAARRHLAST
jgi:hypothetical protein